MARINVPIRLLINNLPAKWRIEVHDSKAFALAEVGDFHEGVSRDVWELRARFFALPATNDALLTFLNETGIWSNSGRTVEHTSTRHISEFPYRTEGVSEIWEYRATLRHALLNKKAFRETYGTNDFEFPIGFRLTERAVEGIIEAYDTSQALLASVYIDVARGIRFKMCARKDCEKLFPLESRHKRKFCSQECGHLASVRRGRARKRKENGGQGAIGKG